MIQITNTNSKLFIFQISPSITLTSHKNFFLGQNELIVRQIKNINHQMLRKKEIPEADISFQLIIPQVSFQLPQLFENSNDCTANIFNLSRIAKISVQKMNFKCSYLVHMKISCWISVNNQQHFGFKNCVLDLIGENHFVRILFLQKCNNVKQQEETLFKVIS